MYNNDNFFGLAPISGSQLTLKINDQQNNFYINSGSIVIFNVSGYPNADFIIQDLGIEEGGTGGSISDFYPYNVINRGQLDSDGNYIFSIPLNKAGTFIFRAGIWCTIADINYCTQVSNTISVTVLEAGCASSYKCRQPLNGYEYDVNGCGGADRLNSVCNPPVVGDGTGSDGKSNLLYYFKIGLAVGIVGIAMYYTSRNGFKVKARDV